MIRLVSFAGLGVAVGGLLLILNGQGSVGNPLLVIGLVTAIWMGTNRLVARAGSGKKRVSPALLENAILSGRIGHARVDDIKQTGLFINEQPNCRLELTVQPLTGPAFRTVLIGIITLVDLPRFEAGSLHPVIILAQDGPEIALVGDLETREALLQRVSHLNVPPASSAGEIRKPTRRKLSDDGTPKYSLLGYGLARTVLNWVVALVMFAAGVMAPLLFFPRTLDHLMHAIPQGQLKLDSWDGYYLKTQMAELQAQIGHDVVSEVTIWSGRVMVDVLVDPSASLHSPVHEWVMEGTSITNKGRVSSIIDAPFALSDVNWESISDLLDQAIAQADLEHLETRSITISRFSEDPVADLRIRIYLSGKFGTAQFMAKPDGSTLTAYGGDLPEVADGFAFRPGYLGPIMAQFLAELGHDQIVDLSISNSRISIDAISAPGSSEAHSWVIVGATIYRSGTVSSFPNEVHETFSAGQVNWDAIAYLVEQAHAASGIPVGTAKAVWVYFDHDTVFSDGTLTLRITITDTAGYTTFYANPDGSGFRTER